MINNLRNNSRFRRDLTLKEYYRYAILGGQELSENILCLHSNGFFSLFTNSTKRKRKITSTLRFRSKKVVKLIRFKEYSRKLNDCDD